MPHATNPDSENLLHPGRPIVSIAQFIGLLTFVWGLSSASLLGDPDSYWHVAVGRWIVGHAKIPTSDVFSHSVPGLDWTAHEWLSELVLYGVHQLAGWQGIQILAAVAFATTVGIMLRFLLDRMEPLHAVLLAAICIEMMRTHFLARPHVLVWPLTAIWVGTLVRASERRSPPPWWLLAVLLLWTNLHASFTLALGFGAAFAMDAVLQAGTTSDRIAVGKRWALFLFACSGCVLMNPRGFGAISHTLEVMRMRTTLSMVNEWRSADFHQFQMMLVWLLGIMALAFSGRLKLSPVRIVFLIGLTYLALKHQRYQALLGLVSPFLLAAPIAAALRIRMPDGAKQADRLDRWFKTMAHPARRSGWLLVGLAGAAFVAAMWESLPARPNAAATPERALAAFVATGVRGNVMNEYGLGGYLIYRDVPVFVDGRGDMYGDAFMGEMREAFFLQGPNALENLLTKYDIGWTLLSPKTPAVELLNHLPEWERIYGDSVAVVHVRRKMLREARTKTSG